jgi:hypothetical protein
MQLALTLTLALALPSPIVKHLRSLPYAEVWLRRAVGRLDLVVRPPIEHQRMEGFESLMQGLDPADHDPVVAAVEAAVDPASDRA